MKVTWCISSGLQCLGDDLPWSTLKQISYHSNCQMDSGVLSVPRTDHKWFYIGRHSLRFLWTLWWIWVNDLVLCLFSLSWNKLQDLDVLFAYLLSVFIYFTCNRQLNTGVCREIFLVIYPAITIMEQFYVRWGKNYMFQCEIGNIRILVVVQQVCVLIKCYLRFDAGIWILLDL